jgi:hypothetical protein
MGLKRSPTVRFFYSNKIIHFSFLTYSHRLLRKERTSRNFLNVSKIRRYKTNFSKRMIHRDEVHRHQKWTDGVASPRKERQKRMTVGFNY